MVSKPRIVQVGLGNFGKRHLEAWHRLGLGNQLWIAEPNEAKWVETERFRFPKERLVRSLDEVIDRVDVVDIVTPTNCHAALATQALDAGKHVFLEKPMTQTSSEANVLAELAQRQRRLIQVGFYYRYHPASQKLKALIAEGALGDIRYLTGNFMGFKRARNDVGVMHTDGIHFLDLFNWLIEEQPKEVFAVCRDHFKRGLEDFALALMTYPAGTLAKVEAGYIQPGRWNDKVVPGAKTSKEITIVGSKATVEIDFETEILTLHDAHHELRDGTWTAVLGESRQVPVPSCDPVQMVCRELEAFLSAIASGAPSPAGPVESGVAMAALIEGIYDSARTGQPVTLHAAPEFEGAVAS